MTFYGGSRVAASSKQDLFVSEMMSQTISADAYADCLLRGREVHFTWERVGGVDVVMAYSPLRGFDGRPVGAISVPLVFTKDEVGQRMEWTSMALSYLVAVVTAAIFVLGFVLARRISGPIRELIRGTLRVSANDFGFTIPKPSDDEIGDLVDSFNSMTAARGGQQEQAHREEALHRDHNRQRGRGHHLHRPPRQDRHHQRRRRAAAEGQGPEGAGQGRADAA